MKDKTIGVIGRGFVGDAVFQGFKLYNEVMAFDVNPKKSTHSIREVVDCDFVFISVPTPMETVEGGKGDPSFVNGVLENIAKMGYREETVFILKSTVPIGTTDRCISEYGINICTNTIDNRVKCINKILYSAVKLRRKRHLFTHRFKDCKCFSSRYFRQLCVQGINNHFIKFVLDIAIDNIC